MLNNLPKSSDTSHFQKGFTLVELVVVIGTMAILFSLGYANYRDFQRRQQLDSVVRAFKVDMRLAQQLALTGKKENECGSLKGYRIKKAGAQSYQIGAVCDVNENCDNTPSYCVKTVEIPSNITISAFPGPGNRFTFLSFTKGVDRAATITFTQDVTGNTRSVEISQSGEIK